MKYIIHLSLISSIRHVWSKPTNVLLYVYYICIHYICIHYACIMHVYIHIHNSIIFIILLLCTVQ